MSTAQVDFHVHWDATNPDLRDGNPSALLAFMDRHAISRAILLPTRALMDARFISRENSLLAEVAHKSQGRLIPLGTVTPWNESDACEETVRCFDELLLPGLKFHPWLQGFSVNSPIMDEICHLAEIHHRFLFFHDGTPPCSLPSQIGLLAHRHPRVTFVLGHCGLLEFWREALMVLQSAENVWGCICGPPHAAARTLWKEGPRERLFWGSDFGFGTADLMAYRLAELEAWNLTPKERTQLISDNPIRFLDARIPNKVKSTHVD